MGADFLTVVRSLRSVGGTLHLLTLINGCLLKFGTPQTFPSSLKSLLPGVVGSAAVMFFPRGGVGG